MFLYTDVTDKQLRETSRDYLVINNPREKPYDVLVVNGTELDRTALVEFEDNQGNAYTSLAHYIACRKLLFWKMSQEMVNECYRMYTIPFPMTVEFQQCDFETDLYVKYAREISLLPDTMRMQWRENYVQIAVEGILLLLSQHSHLKQKLKDTGNKVLVEVSGSVAWGTDTTDNFLKTAFPKQWMGENGYGQALMIARTILTEK